MKYHLITLGCQMNKSDSERVRTVLDDMGFLWTDDEKDADVLGILACSVRQKAIDRVYSRIHRWNQWKDDHNLLTFVTGCVLPEDRLKFLKLFDFVFTMNELPNFPDMVKQYGVVSPHAIDTGDVDDAPEVTVAAEPPAALASGSTLISLDALVKKPETVEREVMADLWKVDATPDSDFAAYVPIQNGCDKFCTFCAVPYTRGREVSRKSEQILAEVERLIKRGYRSITLLGQNVNSYGLDRPDTEMSFAQLLSNIGQMARLAEKPFWVYYTSPHPRDMTRDVIEAMAEYPCIGRQVHLPLQSGDDRVLLRMNRQHSLKAYRQSVEIIRDLLPDATLFTDIIVGFTGETEAQFANTLKAIDEFRFNMIFVAKYSPRPGAASSRWKDDVPHDIKGDRLQRVNDLAIKYSTEWNQRMVGQVYPVLITGVDRKKENMAGLTEGKVNVRIPGVHRDLIGTCVDVKVAEAVSFCVMGERVDVPVTA
jgi:tRNA-2-methylthio-N6-dimethylallyladenosine synthase